MTPRRLGILGGALGAVIAAFATGPAAAEPCVGTRCTIDDGIASFTYDAEDDAPDDGALPGIEGWVVNGVEHLFLEVFAIRIVTDDGVPDRTFNFGELELDSLEFTDDDVGGIHEITAVHLLDGGLGSIALTLSLSSTSGTTTTSTILETIEITLLRAVDEVLFFEHTDFDLKQTFNDDSGLGTLAALTQTDGNVTATVTPDTSTPATKFQTDNVSGLFFDIEDGSLADLSNVGDDGKGNPLVGDINHAFMWRFVPTATNLTFTVIKEKRITIVPAPAPLGLMGLGLVGLGLARRKARA